MKHGYSYLELVFTLGILAVMFASFMFWQRGYVRQVHSVQTYYQTRQTILNRLARDDYDRTLSAGGIKYNEIDWAGYGKIISFSF